MDVSVTISLDEISESEVEYAPPRTSKVLADAAAAEAAEAARRKKEEEEELARRRVTFAPEVVKVKPVSPVRAPRLSVTSSEEEVDRYLDRMEEALDYGEGVIYEDEIPLTPHQEAEKKLNEAQDRAMKEDAEHWTDFRKIPLSVAIGAYEGDKPWIFTSILKRWERLRLKLLHIGRRMIFGQGNTVVDNFQVQRRSSIAADPRSYTAHYLTSADRKERIELDDLYHLYNLDQLLADMDREFEDTMPLNDASIAAYSELTKQRSGNHLNYVMLDMEALLRRFESARQTDGREAFDIVDDMHETECDRWNGDEMFWYNQTIQFRRDSCEFSPCWKHIVRMRRKWRKEPTVWRTTTKDEVSLHRFHNDGWTYIKGRVYDLTTSFQWVHPGGSRPLAQTFGDDGTWVFIGVHPYVVWYQHMVGIEISRIPDFIMHKWINLEPLYMFDGLDLWCEWFCKGPHPLKPFYPKIRFRQRRSHYIYEVEFFGYENSTKDHWFFFVDESRSLKVRYYVKGMDMWFGALRLPLTLTDDTLDWTFENNFNKLTIWLEKPFKDRKRWWERRAPVVEHVDNNMFFNNYSIEDWIDGCVIRKDWFSDHVCMYTVAYDESAFVGIPLGFFVDIQILGVTRSYTPIVFPLIEDAEELGVDSERVPGQRGYLTFLIRPLVNRPMGKRLMRLDVDPKVPSMRISPPHGNFDPEFLFSGMDVMMIIAGGTGIAPFIRIMRYYLDHRELLEGKTVILMYFNKNQEDVVLHNTWHYIKETEAWFHYYPILTRTDYSPLPWNGLTGHPGQAVINRVLELVPETLPAQENDTLKVMVCGTYKFSHWAQVEMTAMALTPQKNIFYFLGSLFKTKRG